MIAFRKELEKMLRLYKNFKPLLYLVLTYGNSMLKYSTSKSIKLYFTCYYQVQDTRVLLTKYQVYSPIAFMFIEQHS